MVRPENQLSTESLHQNTTRIKNEDVPFLDANFY